MASQRKPSSKTPILKKLSQQLQRRAKKIGTATTRKFSTEEFSETVSMALADKLEFGKYKSKTIRKILSEDPTYLIWLLDNNKTIRYNKAVMKQLAAFVATDEQIEYDPTKVDWLAGLEDTL